MIKLIMIKRAYHVASMGEIRNACIILVGRPQGSRPLEISVGEKVILKQILKKVCEVADWNHVAQDRDQWWDLVITVMDLWFLKKAGSFLTS
jgi:hypothetical protein